MGRIEREAFIVGPTVAERVRRLNQAVHEAEVLPMVGGSGTGKDRFLDWWWQVGCVQQAGEHPHAIVQPDDIILVSAQPSPTGAAPVACGLFTKIWCALLELERARIHGEPPRPLGRTTPCNPDRVASMLYRDIYPLMDDLQPLAIVIGDAQHLNKQTLGSLLELRTPIRRNRPKIARCALILCASVEADVVASSGFSKLLNGIDETRAIWPNKLEFGSMDGVEFSAIIAMLIRRNLNTVFGGDVVAKEVILTLADWTDANWWLIVELVKVLDQCLGAQRDDQPRILDRKMLEQIEQTWIKRRPRT